MKKCTDNSYMSVFYNSESENVCQKLKSSVACHVDGKVMTDNIFCAEKCHPINCTCSTLFMQKKEGGCKSYQSTRANENSISSIRNVTPSEAVFCIDGKRIPVGVNNDLVPDCSNQSDEKELKHILHFPHLMKKWSCDSPTEFPCFPGHSRCYEFHKQCLYELHPIYNTLLHCRSGEHLNNCSKLACTAAFKCPQYYCLPWKLACDAKWDCPHGQDETNCLERSCAGMFKCLKSTICIHTIDVCNGLLDCPLLDDHIFCDLPKVCPNFCICLNYGIKCSKIISLSKMEDIPFVFIHLETMNLLNVNVVFTRFKNAIFLQIVKNRFAKICVFYLRHLLNVKVFDVSNNLITKICSKCFHTLTHLRILQLNYNQINILAGSAFLGLYSLQSLGLSNNQITSIDKQMFEHLCTLQHLQISSNPLTSIASNAFADLPIRIVVTDDHKLCCFFKNQAGHICTQPIAWPYTCGKLVRTPGYVAAFWTISVAVIILNALSMVTACSTKKSNVSVTKNYKHTTLALNIADTQVGVHLLTLSIVDQIFGNTFTGKEYTWRRNIFCHIFSSFSLFFLLLSIFVSLYLALSRLIVTKFPLRAKFMKVKRHLSFLSVIGVLVTLLIVVSYTYIEQISIQPLPLCMLLGNPQQSVALIITSIFISCLQALGIFVLITVYSYVLSVLKKSDMSDVTPAHKLQKIDSTVSTRAKIICTSNALCWPPSGVLYVLPLTTTSFPSQLLLTNLIFIVPINATVNPVILHHNLLTEFSTAICSKFWIGKCKCKGGKY